MTTQETTFNFSPTPSISSQRQMSTQPQTSHNKSIENNTGLEPMNNNYTYTHGTITNHTPSTLFDLNDCTLATYDQYYDCIEADMDYYVRDGIMYWASKGVAYAYEVVDGALPTQVDPELVLYSDLMRQAVAETSVVTSTEPQEASYDQYYAAVVQQLTTWLSPCCKYMHWSHGNTEFRYQLVA